MLLLEDINYLILYSAAALHVQLDATMEVV